MSTSIIRGSAGLERSETVGFFADKLTLQLLPYNLLYSKVPPFVGMRDGRMKSLLYGERPTRLPKACSRFVRLW